MINTSCILTVIKNEQEYLDEWIRYHLDLGIDHIFIFEDLDSDSHKEITDKYSNKVTLDSVSTILNREDKKKAIELKQTKKSSVHRLYLKRGLLYMQKEYSNLYTWCFTIDNDEFITFENENSNIRDILNIYNEYDAFILSWKCYGANGIINKPNYSDKGVVETYLTETSCNDIEKEGCSCKTCYNLLKYNADFFNNSHYPNDNCNWCNSVNIKDSKKQIFKNIYLRHYITKSLEEYVWKLNTRGFMWGGRRNYDFFFKVNPDMLDRKDELIKKFEKEILVVLPYKGESSQGNEIRLALNSWKKFCQFNYHFIVIGTFNDSLKKEYPWVEFIYYQTIRKKKNQYNPHIDMHNKYRMIENLYSGKYDGFIRMVDDNYAIKPFYLEDIMTTHYHSLSFTGDKKAPINFWNHDKWKTQQLLDKYNLPHINYTTHYPRYFEFSKLKEVWDKFNMDNESYVLEDIYFNYFKHDDPILDNEIRLGIWSNDIYKNEFQKAIENPNIKFVCNSVDGWSKELEKSLENIINKED
jgi:hypothetical protein